MTGTWRTGLRRDGIESDVRHAVRRSFLTSRVSPPHVTLSLLITRSVHVGSSGSVGLVVSRSPRHPSFGSLFTPIPARAEPKVRRRDGMGCRGKGR